MNITVWTNHVVLHHKSCSEANKNLALFSKFDMRPVSPKTDLIQNILFISQLKHAHALSSQNLGENKHRVRIHAY